MRTVLVTRQNVRHTWVQVGPILEAMEDVLALLLRSLDGRVYVAVGRGLWDFTSKEIYDYVDSLQEGKENKVRRRLSLLVFHLCSLFLCCTQLGSCNMSPATAFAQLIQ